MKFSVIISVFNKEGFIGNTIQSVLNQSLQDFEIIVVDDCSTDQSQREILSLEDDRIKYYRNSQNQGAGATRNRALSLATGTYIALLDGDDLWYPHYLSEIERLIYKFPSHKVFATAIDIEDHDGVRSSSYSFQNQTGDRHLSLDYFTSSFKNTLLTSSSTVIERSVFDEIGNYDASIKSGQDTDLWIRLGLAHKIAFSTLACAKYLHAPLSLYKGIKSVKDRPTFQKYIPYEKENPGLKKFLDLNRFSLAVRAKIWNENDEAQKFIDQIDLENLNTKQRKILRRSGSQLKVLFKTKKILEKIGLRLSAFS
ncbi:glycosyltransferase family 2 protein [Dokdonia sinensis]|uniref:Glycosyltransferase family 2 protein n=1 Tax=Dokdonia sinensis TaxID=2479847 RepID=A0A3M0G7K8_9FLAO|nr:glycosyltransferase family 2 protein [Dokdonia sinensis]RMB60468.1 glycosyltransferase family 2 protein [Dokdonia sinensis]